MIQFNNIYQGKRVLVTGHSGFKGSWLSMWLQCLGAKVTGVSLPTGSNIDHFESLDLGIDDVRLDICNFSTLAETFQHVKPEFVFHMAAQPLVRKSYLQPLETWNTNVMGTAHVLELCRMQDSIKGAVVVTTDKCYENKEWPWGYRENDRLGGHDPYSASKAASELLVASYRKSFNELSGEKLIATARAGNVIGGGDWSEDRLVPDLVRAVMNNEALVLRYPNATRPWQHVLDSLSGYLSLGQKLLEGNREFAGAWNFGPEAISNVKVIDFLNMFKEEWSEINWRVCNKADFHEGSLLYLDSAKSRSKLDWNPTYNLSEAISTTANWYRSYLRDGNVDHWAQLSDYLQKSQIVGASWMSEY